MSRCVLFGAALAAALSMPLAVHAQHLVQRQFPQDTLRGELVVVQPPDVRLNGRPARLSPGARIRGQNNLLVMSGAIVGTPLVVNYTVDNLGQVKDVWVLREDEAKKVWPKTREEAARWSFDPIAQVWVKR
ncbi:hypothetical protein IS481_03910 [Caldimonas thermodepolymerans]|jgi:hypothetical protein|uniref:Uncharacterized protein n=1 Tax=Caldimonas thermodepolymerans TaxID=215580 RepID=A0A2S5T227_9BURK|nr:hypothetical protein [Caldimonas thermodepolymerans]PPE69030.1 hypothetical protein C1702_14285 [Caldimonas thermodepolymerans]QPC32329.1 hypothetical protein IS481_03910 [Caldimonas thermodepolymerans]RDH98227.1 hypothetical protein DES46_107228 [Caldimonas thermodepolymerans]TCP07996.1 hypothetical protein EV676_10326 [Caldimonas thermodepolymerans]UZG48878.1 hypothetical protein ONS87_04455 [Caldimonas thermodepolymerans]